MFLEYMPQGSSKIKRDKSYNKELFNQKKINNSWSNDFVRFNWEKIY